MIQNKINNLVSIAIFFLYNKMLSGHKKEKMVLEMKFQGKTKSKQCDFAMAIILTFSKRHASKAPNPS